MNVRSRRGFTLIELMVVVVILGVLTAVATPQFDFTRKRGYRVTLKSDLRDLLAEQEMYRITSFVYAPSLYAMEFISSEGTDITITEATGAGWAATGVHAGLPGVRCGIFYGEATATNADPATRPGIVSCTE